MRIQIPFNAWSKRKLNTGHKISTGRTKVYGEVGDIFPVDNKDYKIISILRDFPTELIVNYLWYPEGADSPDELRGVLSRIFRGHPLPKTLNLHFFEEIRNATI